MRQLSLTVPQTPEPQRLDRFLCAQLHGLSRRAVKGIVDAGQVRVGPRVERKAGRPLQPGDVVTLDMRPSLLPRPPITEADILARGEGWLAVCKPPGLPSHRPEHDVPGVPERLAELLGGGAAAFRPAHRLDRATSGVLLVALDDAQASALSTAFAQGDVAKEYRAVVAPAPSAGSGTQRSAAPDGPMELSWTVLRRSSDGSRAELSVRPVQGRTHQIRRQLAEAGTPIVGDLLYGTALASGAERMALHCCHLRWDDQSVESLPGAEWERLLQPPPAAPPAPARGPARPPSAPREARGRDGSPPSASPPRRARDLKTLAVSGATARVLGGGHPWVLPDRDTGDLRGFSPGDQALLVDPRGRELGVALVDPQHQVVARLLDDGARAPLSTDDLRARAAQALHRRRAVLDASDTDCARLVSGEADGLPGLAIDRWGDAIVATLACPSARVLLDPALDAVAERFPGARVYLKEHTVDLRRRGQGQEGDDLPGRWIRGGARSDDGSVWVRERSLAFRVEPFAGLTTGLYTDQRSNRDRIRGHLTPRSRIANLFAHTAAFSVSAAAAGVARAVSVDLSPRYCAWAEENLRANGLDPERHPCVAAPSEAWLSETAERFDGVIVDPPAFARARKGDRGWNARRDYRGLVTAVARVLDPGPAWILCVINLKGITPSWLIREVQGGLEDGGRALAGTDGAPPSPDHPVRRGFPEGRPFVGILARVAPQA